MFRIFPESLHIPFMSIRWPAAALSLIVVIASLFFIASKGLNYGVDFSGGVQMVLRFADKVDVNEEKIRESLRGLGLADASVQRFGTDYGASDETKAQEYIVHFSSAFADDLITQAKIESQLSSLKTGEDSVLESFRFSGLEKAFFRTRGQVETETLFEEIKKIDFGLLKLNDVSVFGNREAREFELRFKNVAEEVTSAMITSFGEDSVSIQKLDFVGAKVGSDLKTAAILSILVTILLIFIYVFLRFDLAYAPGVVLALAHDVIITVGIFALVGMEFDLTVVAALLAVAGYSINDTIIVYDRIREMAEDLRGKRLVEILDIAISQTLNRTIITSGTTLIATGFLFVLGGPVIHSFAFALTIGILVGTYSSIFVASVLVLWVDNWLKVRESGSKKKKAA